MTKPLSKHFLFLSLGGVAALTALILNNALSGVRLAHAQMVLWTVLVFAFIAIQVPKSLLRPRQLCIAIALVGLHTFGVMRFKSYFPLDNMVVAFVGIGLEAVIVLFLYARIGQSVDPRGPFGLSEAEIHAREMKQIRPK